MSNQELYSEIDVNVNVAKELGLTEAEYEKILEVLGRVPTYTELGVYSVMWSEHCSYKNSILQLKTLPRSGKNLLVEAGEENAGLIDIGDGYGIAFKIESHNHPSAIEPFQGAATGVGGILRDIFSMGARPIAALNSLRFGKLDDERTKYLLRGVVKGISHYGNCFGVPTVGGEIYFDNSYKGNPLVNAMAVGIVEVGKTASAAAKGVGNPVFIFGSSTGRDGIHGASLLASREFDEHTEDMRPTVQVGDPFEEKKLLEATLEMIDQGLIVSVQDMGAAGISCSTSEMSATNGLGMDVELDDIPLRETDMSAYEIMLSESQERMLAVIEKGREQEAIDIAAKWDITMKKVAVVTDQNRINLNYKGKKVAALDAHSLVLGGGAPVYVREASEPKYMQETRNFNLDSLKTDLTQTEILYKLLTDPTIASKRWVYEQYDSQVRTNTVNIKGDAAVLRLKEIPGKGIAMKTDCNSTHVYLNPYKGGMGAVCESARNVACVGARPVAITNCLNFGNPYDPEVYFQFSEAIKGMGDACRRLETPVTGGNVSFHNETKTSAINPTPTIGMLGLIDDLTKVMSSEFKNEGDDIYLLGSDRKEIGGSQYLKTIFDKVVGDAPDIDIDEEANLIDAILELIGEGVINSAHDTSEGGITVCLAEKAMSSDGLGCQVNIDGDNASLFGESHSRIIISASPEQATRISEIAVEYNLGLLKMGTVIEDDFIINDSINEPVEKLLAAYESALPNIMNK
ncbi:MAG: phosphoribosylformylglycinamidine synthase subunit PurL [Candidatus Kapaibacterium sp.]|nr:phosphoribosylformylglycinamidine synthase subunit PurL [Ignavibacteriota bacterium]MCB9222085.1 phosphoribosylformylglycinamidine synthase subunit PurL [Ignavibacteria bacterium]